ncbi:Low-affinity iron/zinc ion transport protein fet4 [Cyphellophora attinorum]|uniref:Low-affinity iron/zinc ion transport protein fet4 n=1 Tax=Cyphellophora attinorum TaxID=1664694 RepID=A0A0N1NWX3_9EURO|nr:Low-affinity iron/zinc ion transport protein fet4 [Phialophora attinorum]KPI36354.1 Low-affinity iron/zinc ion transport protein fet4 [Phialophora attinorum]
MLDIRKILSAPGARQTVTKTAPSPFLPHADVARTEKALGPARAGRAKNDADSTCLGGFLALDHISEDVQAVVDGTKTLTLDRWLDRLVAWAGSWQMLLFTFILVLSWAFLGIPFGNATDWQVAISDVQALACYVLDSLLMRQQLNAYDHEIGVAAILQSRSVSIRRMIGTLHASKTTAAARESNAQLLEPVHKDTYRRSRLDSTIHALCQLFGSLPSLLLFWVCIIVWLSFGPYCSWSAEWQLYINSATSALMLLVFMLLACVQEQHRCEMKVLSTRVCTLDSKLEVQLRIATRDNVPNEVAAIYPCPVSLLERAISYYADLVGTLFGVSLLILVFIAWVAIGPALQFNSNWWLVIGTYAGLIGLHDGFVLHNVRHQLDRNSRLALAKVNADDTELLAAAGVPHCEPFAVQHGDVEGGRPRGQSQQAYSRINIMLSSHLVRLMSHPLLVVAGIVFIAGSVAAATALHWSLTGQLLCNVPPSVVETFIMMALITRETADAKAEKELYNEFAGSRDLLLTWVLTQRDGSDVDSRSGPIISALE